MMNLTDCLTSLTSSKRIIISLVLLLAAVAYAQEEPDSLITQNSELSETFEMQKSPWGAVLRSAVLPGWGQFYNESYWKIPVVWGTLAWFAYNRQLNHDNYQDWKNRYSDSIAEDAADERARTLRTFYQDQRDLFTVYFALAYLLQLVDAYVGAHLFDFSVSQDINSGMPQLHMQISW